MIEKNMNNNDIKLIKFLVLAQAGSRRDCQRMLVEDRISVNGEPNHQPSFPINPEKDKVALDGKSLTLPQTGSIYIRMNKPVGTICTHEDPHGRKTVYSLLHHRNLSSAGLFSAGRLDFNTSGLLILTNDGAFANYLTHPRYDVKKEYIVHIKRPLDKDLIRRMLKGVRIDEQTYKFDRLYVLKEGPKSSIIRVVLNEGKNREIRKVMQFFKVTIRSIERIKMGPFLLGNLPSGQYQLIKKSEVEEFKNKFKAGSSEPTT